MSVQVTLSKAELNIIWSALNHLTRGQESVITTKYGSVSKLAAKVDNLLSTGHQRKDLDLLWHLTSRHTTGRRAHAALYNMKVLNTRHLMNKKYELTIQSKSGTFLQRHIVSRQTAQTVCDFVKYNGYGNYADVKLIVAECCYWYWRSIWHGTRRMCSSTWGYSRLLLGRVPCVNILRSKHTIYHDWFWKGNGWRDEWTH